MAYSVAELCIGAGGQALGLEHAGLTHALGIDTDRDACATVRHNRPGWDVRQADIRNLDGRDLRGIDVLAAGIPCPPFSVAGQQKGSDDERDLFPTMLRLVRESRPMADLIENVPGFASSRFNTYREAIFDQLRLLGYELHTNIFNAADFGVPQLRPRFVMVGIKTSLKRPFTWPQPSKTRLTIGDALYPFMAECGWAGALAWRDGAQDIAPTLVGGSKKHGGADLGPTRAKAKWASLSVDGKGVADAPPNTLTPLDAMPRLTNRMAARVQGFPEDWVFLGKKTSVYRQIGNAFPPPVATAIGQAIVNALAKGRKKRLRFCSILMSNAPS